MTMLPLLSAIQFLTIIPIRSEKAGEPEVFSRAPWWFPAVGLLIGFSMAWLDFGLGFILPDGPRTVLVVAGMLGISGGLHLDGLADSADAFFSSRPKDRMLEIMKDSRSGPMGIMAIVLILLLKTTALAAVHDKYRFGTIVLMALSGRTAICIMMGMMPYAREQGLATIFGKSANTRLAVFASVFLLIAAYVTHQQIALFGALGAIFICARFCSYAHKKIGGYTGDTLGAVCELAELGPVLGILAIVEVIT